MEKILKKYNTKNNTIIKKSNYIFILFAILSFFIGRVSIFHMLNPIAIGYLSCLIFKKYIFNISLIFIFIGLFSKSSDFYISKYIICLCFIAISNNIFQNTKYIEKQVLKIYIGSISIFLSGLIISFINGFSMYYFVLSVLEAFLTICIIVILNKGITYILKENKKILTIEEIISLSILIGSVICGSSDLRLGVIHFNYVFLNTLVLFISYIYGSSIGGIVSILCSSLMIITGSITQNFILTLTLSSILCGLIREKGKILTTITFLISNFILALITDIALIDNTLIFSVLISISLFLTIPCRLKATLSFNNSLQEESATYTDKLKGLTSEKLNTYATSFEKLSKTFYTLSDKKTNLDQNDITNLVDEVVSKVCANCQMKSFCWENNFYNTYQSIFSLLNSQENNGYTTEDKANTEFINTCINVSQFIDILNKTFEIYKLNLMWKNKIIESRELIGQQLTGVSNIINDLSEKLSEDVNFKENLSAKIKKYLLQNKIPARNVIITENKEGKTEILLKVEPCYVPNKCTKPLISIINEVLGKKMCRESYNCLIKKENNESLCTIRLVEEQKFRISTCVLTEPKNTSLESGDSHSFINIPNGNYLLALSDGMGSGKKAKMESKATIELLEDFLTAGFSKELAINMINSVLFLKSSKESFSTLDICTINLYNGFCEFIKIGAVSTFIIHKGKVDVIKSNSLPVGILNNVEPEIRKKKLSSEDIIIMVTDGVIDSKNTIINKEDWIIQLLQNINSKNHEEIANTIFTKTKENYKDKIKDDITIIVAKIWETYS